MRGEPRIVEYKGERISVPDLARRVGIGAKLLHVRIFQMGWPVERAAETPPAPKNRRGGKPAKNAPRPVPALKRRSDNGAAYVRWKMAGVNHVRMLGRHGSAEATAAYRKFAADWVAGKYDVQIEAPAGAARGLLLASLIERWAAHVEKHYTKNGTPTSVVSACAKVSRDLNDLFGTLPAADFLPAHLREVREKWVSDGLARLSVNRYQWCAVKMFKWAASFSLIPAAVYDALKLVEQLRAGRTAAPDRDRKKPATDAQVEATIPHLCPRDPARAARVAAMIRVQRLTGMRPGEICALSKGDIDTAGDVWRYTVGRTNKNLHRGKAQVYYLGPKAVALLKPHLDGAPERGPIFGETPMSYGKCILYASVKAGAKWTPHQLRHALATAVAERFRSLEHAAAAIGDTSAVAEAVYVHVDPQERAKIEIAKAMG